MSKSFVQEKGGVKAVLVEPATFLANRDMNPHRTRRFGRSQQRTEEVANMVFAVGKVVNVLEVATQASADKALRDGRVGESGFFIGNSFIRAAKGTRQRTIAERMLQLARLLIERPRNVATDLLTA